MINGVPAFRQESRKVNGFKMMGIPFIFYGQKSGGIQKNHARFLSRDSDHDFQLSPPVRQKTHVFYTKDPSDNFCVPWQEDEDEIHQSFGE